MTAYIKQLKKASDESQAARRAELTARAEAERSGFDSRLTPLVDRLRSLIASMPVEERGKPRPLEFFRCTLRGRQGRSAQAGEVGNALRSIGWVRRRSWSDVDGGFKALWFPIKL